MTFHPAKMNGYPAIAVALVVTCAPARADDWPRWRGPGLDGISRETGLLAEWPKGGPRRLWEIPLSGGFSSVAVADGKLFTLTKEGNQEVVLCLNAATGGERWRYRYDCDYKAHRTFTGGGMPASRTGPRATPAVDGGRLYTLGATGILLCLDTKTGGLVWRQDLLQVAGRTCPAHGYCGCPLVVGERVYVQAGGPNGKSLAALDKHDGRIVWHALDDGLSPSSPIWAVVGGSPQVIFFTGQRVVGVRPQDGKLLWGYPWSTRYDLNIATPIYADGKVFISSNYGAGGALLRLTGTGEPEKVWKSLSMQNHFSTSVLWQGHLYGSSESRLRCVDVETGKVAWDKANLGRVSLVVADGRLIILGEHGQLILARLTPTAYREISRCQLFDAQTLTWTVPVLSDGRLFVRSQNGLVALDVRAAGK
jgi:outer membrane protein assembly factor BamB